MSTPQHISSRDNPLVQRLRRLASETTAYRRQGQVWLEGEHLCAALRSRGLPAAQAVLTEDAWQQPALRQLAGWAAQVTTVPSALFKTISGLESPASIGFLFELPTADGPLPGVNTVVLDRVQDAGNVGSILRSAAALGIAQVLAIKGTAGLWSPKVLRAGMGAHFGLRLIERLDESALAVLEVPLVATSSHGGAALHQAALPVPCAWLLGHEGQGVSAALLQRCALQVRIPQPGGEESLNVAAAAAICLYESATRLSRPQ
jgi:TrmH family RNA methyltransferase